MLATITGPTRTLLAAERTALNLLCRMSGVATHTRAWADELAGTGAQVLDTRKTTPGLRVLEKYAVRAGGGTNKRMGLYDVAMIKDNHKLAAGSITAAFERVRAAYPEVIVQVEVTTVGEAREAVAAGATFLLCDNMSPAAAARGRRRGRGVGRAGGDRRAHPGGGAQVSPRPGSTTSRSAALTHSSPIVDIALDLRAEHPSGVL